MMIAVAPRMVEEANVANLGFIKTHTEKSRG